MKNLCFELRTFALLLLTEIVCDRFGGRVELIETVDPDVTDCYRSRVNVEIFEQDIDDFYETLKLEGMYAYISL